MRFRVSHTTEYVYGSPVSLCHTIAHLKPRQTDHQRCIKSQVRVSPWPSVSREHTDIFGNRVSYFSIQQSHAALAVSAVSEVEITAPEALDDAASPPWEEVRARLHAARQADAIHARMFAVPSPAIPTEPAAMDYALASFTPGRPVLEAARELMARIYAEFDYDPTATGVATPIAEVLAKRRGVCQDFAHVGIACLRALGLAARYVSGYLETLPPPGQPKLRGADASHAWYALYLPPSPSMAGVAGPLENTTIASALTPSSADHASGATELSGTWIDYDPTNDCLLGEQHVTTAVGRDYGDVTPVRGVFYGGGEHQLSVAVDVDRLDEGTPIGISSALTSTRA
ncbi:MAG: transglutaminase family protein [Thiohalocapsa sp.]|jgi:transglutaminase-like putative cysteine protease|uniref:transglutaminase family protein n=1 Tax=Thiohalocapsa sp. TaxID=2497641 RepID=UPI0025E4970E|nr:transglutaminase family protein [Thiohalocapsa sp.]